LEVCDIKPESGTTVARLTAKFVGTHATDDGRTISEQGSDVE
jgi:hypothetical protein